MMIDVNGRTIEKGDVVAPLTGDARGKVCETRTEDGEGFVCVRASHRPYSRGVWYAAEHVQCLTKAKPRDANLKSSRA